jgi:hypothetical protein
MSGPDWGLTCQTKAVPHWPPPDRTSAAKAHVTRPSPGTAPAQVLMKSRRRISSPVLHGQRSRRADNVNRQKRLQAGGPPRRPVPVGTRRPESQTLSRGRAAARASDAALGVELRKRVGQPTRTANAYMPHGLASGAFLRMISSRNSVDYAGRIRQGSARAEAAADRNRAPHRAASERRGRFPHHAGKPDFFGFTRCRAIRAFENRTKAATSCVCVFEPAAQGEKARVFARARVRPST